MGVSAQGPPTKLAAVTAQIWERGRGEVMRRVMAVEEAVAGVLRGDLDEPTRAQAERDAHKLAGSLGMFGFPEGSSRARELEQALSGAVQPPSDGPALAAAAVLLRRELEATPARQEPDEASPEGRPDPRPDQAPVAMSRAGAAPIRRAAPADGPAGETRVLAVDDDPLVLEALRALLGAQGIEVTALADPLGFWPAIEEEAPHLVVLDLEMPGASGIELCRALRAEERFAQLPVIFLSAHRDPHVVQRIFEAGADDYVTKPIVGPELVTRIDNRLERVRLYRELADRDPLTGVLNRRSAT